eukprot:CAMPEP_0176202952 /NCGR_PEP_ID=MMETSP0121_2-20121125/10333_1 /TAXON_ID=160619 /ORGANISM="Kryptoperidinium foliaceum, Strain CCMP 1326" /LENGTH=72 /DNA_ID=CAMNT_0017541849 /DNA_START=1 /DNA_END=219 /DNA_ORIENTATION=+
MWVFISIVWAFLSTFVIIWLPVWESRDTFIGICRAVTGWPKEVEAKTSGADAAPAAEAAPAPEAAPQAESTV